jgi:glycine oxidase
MPDVIVVGAGITGAYISYLLAQAGIDVSLVEQADMVHQASANNPGGINPLHGPGIPGPLLPLALRADHLHRQHQASVAELSGRQFHPETIMRLEIALTDAEYAALKPSYELYRDTEGFSAEWLDREMALKIEPGLHPEIAGALLLHGNDMVDSYHYTLALSEAAMKLGAVQMRGTVTGVGTATDRVIDVDIDHRKMSCGAVVFATGPWAADISGWLGVRIPVEPVKGELLQIAPPGRRLPYHITRGPMGLYSLANGDIMLGGTQEHAGFDIEPSASGYRHIMHGTARLFPGVMRSTVVKRLAALRPVTTDGLPIIGRLPGWQNAYVATGGGPKGVLLSAAMGGVIADMISGSALHVPDVPIDAFDPARFAD